MSPQGGGSLAFASEGFRRGPWESKMVRPLGELRGFGESQTEADPTLSQQTKTFLGGGVADWDRDRGPACTGPS